MSEDNYTEITSQSWISRIGKSFQGILFGLVLIVVAVCLLVWNEGRAVKRHRTLQEGSGTVISVNNNKVNPVNEGKLVHLSGRAVSDEILQDPVFQVSAKALKLYRNVEMYQWEESTTSEEQKKIGGGTEQVTTYTYQRTWSDSPIDSSGFKKYEGHQNPNSMPYSGIEFQASHVTVGAFSLSPRQVSRIQTVTPLLLDQEYSVPESLKTKARHNTQAIYIGDDPAHPVIGDIRISYSQVLPTEISIIAQQTGSSFIPYQTESHGNILLVSIGTHSAQEMFSAAQQSNTILTWALRLLGYVFMAIGLRLLLAPLAVLSDLLPLLGNIVGAGTGLISGLIAALFSCLTIGIAWILYRPVLTIILFVIAGGLAFLTTLVLQKNGAKTGHAPAHNGRPAPPPPPPGS
ncbi:TMEM43 family protein [Desulfogranum japonicum]|uniref:TMEM43 family protein n=1 Tax=Desulfogranum japonicum TaxID=231447 RepID=UPI0003F6EC17|nr:TMEM43 family protein [Desulfogranum japonicum]